MNCKIVFIVILTLCFFQVSTGQKAAKKSERNIIITGKVTTPDKTPVDGAVFYIDNMRTSYITSSNGSFRIKISPSINTLKVVSSIYGSAEKVINGRKSINFILPDSLDNLAAYSGKKVAHTDPPNREKRMAKKMNTYTDIYQMIRHEVPGVVVSGRSIVVQQQNSFFGSSEPLFVVNGVIVNSIDYVSPIEVKSISLLKGSSASIYGVRGANGVISITLLNGSETER